MKNNIFTSILFILTGLNCFSQENYGHHNYNWNELTKVTLQYSVDTEFASDTLLIDRLEKTELKVECGNIRKWKSAFATLPFGPNKDIANESTYILICEFKDGQIIPFKYFPNQYTVFDMRKAYRYYYSFPEKNNRMRNVLRAV